ncbi:hypothetical protein M378DRAFT_156594 [Amanita muscaria Koide BX008]|uniref:NACHT domain-containing protein n=1 Tax=Amanita muscaria (strain Koide BX008) TaxID=946122 RepID=A0A0C2X7Y1_AMAMK|nr:hypothetical protein M378DRAFT_156594 [Amanita muscaria Koide BX008]
MVIDGVDEYTDERMLGQFPRVLVQAGEEPVRFIIICSRPERPRIHAILGRYRQPENAQLPRQNLEDAEFRAQVHPYWRDSDKSDHWDYSDSSDS